MTDGNVLAGDLYLPNSTGTFPTIFIFTPYNKNWYQTIGLPLGVGMDLAQSEYAFLVVDWRCRFGSLSACAFGSDDGEDGYDVVEWAASQPWSDGKIGMWGPSALGGVQFKTAKKQPPSLVCCVPEVAAPHFAYSKYYEGGCMTVETIATLDILFATSGPIVANPFMNLIWDIAESSTMYPDSIEVPMLQIGGWYDKNIDQAVYMSDTLISNSPASAEHKTLIGPWVHGGTGTAIVGSTNQGELNYPAAEKWNEIFALEFFDFHLRGINNGWDSRDRYTYFQMGDDQWNTSSAWPPTGSASVDYYLHGDNSLQTTAPTSTTDSQSLMYDPVDPSPTHGGKTLNLSMVQGPYDQTDSVESRNDNLIFTSPILTEDLIVKGKIKVDLFVASDRLDTDFAVRLTEVYPTGESMLLLESIQRMRFRDGYRVTDTASMVPGTIYNIELELDDIANTFKAGHQVRLIITSSNYPRFNRNMNTGGEMHPNGNYDTLVNPLVATNTVFLNATHPSKIILPTGVNNPLMVAENPELESLEIFPNPTNSFIQLNGVEFNGKAHVDIYSVSGSLVHSAPLSHQDEKVSVNHLKEGMYILHLQLNNGETRTKRFVVSN
ncbi:MAG: CocE/NonD family hydrolase [Crocinitomicaceae bacterium]|nr:CocE/NonD family hydrolase [Crocinitomicaceae bacterium]